MVDLISEMSLPRKQQLIEHVIQTLNVTTDNGDDANLRKRQLRIILIGNHDIVVILSCDSSYRPANIEKSKT